MKVIFEIGDKIYRSDYDEVSFFEMQKVASEFCSQHELSLEEGEDEKGYYLLVACKKGFESEENLEVVKLNKIQELKHCKEELEFSPIEYGEFNFDVDEISLLRIHAIIASLKDEEKISFVDADGFEHHDFTKLDLIEINSIYVERLRQLEKLYFSLKIKVNQCFTVDDVRKINTDGFFMI